MIKNEKKTDTEKQLLQFRHQLHNLLIKFPDMIDPEQRRREVQATFDKAMNAFLL